MAAKTVAFIQSLGHSGSTLLGHFLGAHSRMTHVGEIARPLNAGHPIKCYYCGDGACPVWGGLVTESRLRRCWRGYRVALKRGHRWLAPWLRLAGVTEPPGRLFDHLFARMPEIDVIVDSSKSIAWDEWNSRNREFRSVHLLLVRDLRALVATRLRTLGEDVAQAAKAVVQQLQAHLTYFRSVDPGIRLLVRYELLACQPAETGREICGFLGLDFEPDMLEYYRFEHHTFGGNPGPSMALRLHRNLDVTDLLARVEPQNRSHYRPESIVSGFKVDERWREILTVHKLPAFEAVAGELNREMGYGD